MYSTLCCLRPVDGTNRICCRPWNIAWQLPSNLLGLAASEDNADPHSLFMKTDANQQRRIWLRSCQHLGLCFAHGSTSKPNVEVHCLVGFRNEPMNNGRSFSISAEGQPSKPANKSFPTGSGSAILEIVPSALTQTKLQCTGPLSQRRLFFQWGSPCSHWL